MNEPTFIRNGSLPYIGALHAATDRTTVLAILAQWIDEGQESSDPALACPSWAQHTYAQIMRKTHWTLWKVYGHWEHPPAEGEGALQNMFLGISPRCCNICGSGKREGGHEPYWDRLQDAVECWHLEHLPRWDCRKYCWIDTVLVPDLAPGLRAARSGLTALDEAANARAAARKECAE